MVETSDALDRQPHRHPGAGAGVPRTRPCRHAGHCGRPGRPWSRAGLGPGGHRLLCLHGRPSLPHWITPSRGLSVLQAALGLPEDRPAFDPSTPACSGFLYGMARGAADHADDRRAICPASSWCEALSRLTDPADRSTCVLFGDGAGAASGPSMAEYPLCRRCWGPGAAGMFSMRAGRAGQGSAPDHTWTARRYSALPWMPVPRCLRHGAGPRPG